MGEINWATVTAMITMLLAVVGVMKYVLYVLGQHQQHMDKRFDEMAASVESSSKEVSALRAEVYKEFVRQGEHDNLVTTIAADLRRIFDKVDENAKLLNRLIGQNHGTIPDDD